MACEDQKNTKQGLRRRLVLTTRGETHEHFRPSTCAVRELEEEAKQKVKITIN